MPKALLPLSLPTPSNQPLSPSRRLLIHAPHKRTPQKRYHLDLSTWAFERLAQKKWGVIAVSWRDVPCWHKPKNVARVPSWSKPTPPPSWYKEPCEFFGCSGEFLVVAGRGAGLGAARVCCSKNGRVQTFSSATSQPKTPLKRTTADRKQPPGGFARWQDKRLPSLRANRLVRAWGVSKSYNG